MGKFEFYQDCKVTSWERDYFTVEANSYGGSRGNRPVLALQRCFEYH